MVLFALRSIVYSMNNNATLNFKNIIQEAKDREFEKASIQISFFDALFNHELNTSEALYVTFRDYQKRDISYKYSLQEISNMIIQMVAQIKNSAIEQKITESYIERSAAPEALTKLDLARIQFYRFKQFLYYCPELYEDVIQNLTDCMEDENQSLKIAQSLNLGEKSEKQIKDCLSNLCIKHGLIIKGLIIQDVTLIQEAYKIPESLPSQTIAIYLAKVYRKTDKTKPLYLAH